MILQVLSHLYPSQSQIAPPACKRAQFVTGGIIIGRIARILPQISEELPVFGKTLTTGVSKVREALRDLAHYPGEFFFFDD
ncbi:MAG TPA: hypothetical protein DEH22_16335 [Chloroflexi bacterium]|nr:hypothetical protein [Chloroflexota bacterium]